MPIIPLVKSEKLGFVDLLECLDEKKTVERKIFFDEKSDMDDNMCAILGAFVRGLGYTVAFEGCNENLRKRFANNGFIDVAGQVASNEFPQGSIPYIEITRDDYNKQSRKTLDYIQHHILLSTHVPVISEQVKDKLQDAIHEFFANAFGHTKCTCVHACGKWDRVRKAFHITIVNLGDTIQDNVNRFLNSNWSADDSLRWAMVKGNSTKLDDTGGLGLSIIQEFVEKNEGDFYLISGEGFMQMCGKQSSFSKMDTFFPGTIVNLVFNLKDEKRYIVSSEDRTKVNFEW